MSDVQSPCEKIASFGRGGKLCLDKTSPQAGAEPNLNLIPPPPGLFDDRVTVSAQAPGQERSTAEQLYQKAKDFPVRPMLGSAKGVKVTIKTDLL